MNFTLKVKKLQRGMLILSILVATNFIALAQNNNTVNSPNLVPAPNCNQFELMKWYSNGSILFPCTDGVGLEIPFNSKEFHLRNYSGRTFLNLENTEANTSFLNKKISSGIQRTNISAAGTDLDQTGYTFQFEDLDGTLSNLMFLSNSGMMGLGTGKPTSKLEIESKSSIFEFSNTNILSPNLTLTNLQGFNFIDFKIKDELPHGRIGTYGSKGVYKFYLGVLDNKSGEIRNSFVINEVGNIGLNTETPKASLQVDAVSEGIKFVDNTVFPHLNLNNTTQNTERTWTFFDFNNLESTQAPIARIGAYYTRESGGQLYLGTSDGKSLQSSIIINSKGAVGIGWYNGNGLRGALDVNGSIFAEGNAYFSGNTGVGILAATERLEVNGAIKIGNTTNSNPSQGTLVYDANTKQFKAIVDGTGFKKILTEADIDRTWTKINNQVYLTNTNDNLGIGTANPTEKLVVNGAIKIGNTNNTGQGIIKFYENKFYAHTEEAFYQIITEEDEKWKTNANGINSVSMGNVGIGTTNPTQKLEVAGAIKIGNTSICSAGTLKYDDNNHEMYACLEDGFYKILTEKNELWKRNDNTLYTESFLNNVGIGTSTPADKLQINEGADRLVIGTISGLYGLEQLGYGRAYIGFNCSRSGDATAPWQIQALPTTGNNGGSMIFSNPLGDLRFITVETTAPSASGDKNLTDLQMSERTRLIIRGVDGNVGIGTTNPASKLDIVSSNKTGLTITNNFIVDPVNPSSSTTGISFINNFNNNLQNQIGMHVKTTTSGVNANNYGIVSEVNTADTRAISVKFSDGGSNNNVENFAVLGNGKVYAREFNVTLSTFPDFVFNKDYKLLSLSETENFINTNGHLPGIPSESEVIKEGLDLGQMNALLLQKIEEITLHLIQMEKQNTNLEEQNNLLKQEVEILKTTLNK